MQYYKQKMMYNLDSGGSDFWKKNSPLIMGITESLLIGP